ncbi:hypothetical protein G7059_08030 [Erysipelothrix sp. HDW6A]|uniref:hypothetical protein n=1 Tax=Erysipelothrix sp. HDW6A TaxID=2714928 RepID=UPI00140DF21A|nr:hypothetical protein [Erysipelothrix sp. HDW6A]QIK57790.1 hypothetical protein G7059_08030 [Erysipelothrix sp. HDW6A]
MSNTTQMKHTLNIAYDTVKEVSIQSGRNRLNNKESIELLSSALLSVISIVNRLIYEVENKDHV